MRAGVLIVLALAQFTGARQALDLGRTRDSAMFDSFNRGYELAAADPLDRVEIITEFRRAVLLVRDKFNIGEFGMTERDLVRAMERFEGQVGFIAEVRLHPLHTFSRPPAYEMYVATGPKTKPIAAVSMRRDPIFPPGLGLGSPFTGVRLEGAFKRADIEAAAEPMLTVTDEKANILWQGRIDLSRYR